MSWKRVSAAKRAVRKATHVEVYADAIYSFDTDPSKRERAVWGRTFPITKKAALSLLTEMGDAFEADEVWVWAAVKTTYRKKSVVTLGAP